MSDSGVTVVSQSYRDRLVDLIVFYEMVRLSRRYKKTDDFEPAAFPLLENRFGIQVAARPTQTTANGPNPALSEDLAVLNLVYEDKSSPKKPDQYKGIDALSPEAALFILDKSGLSEATHEADQLVSKLFELLPVPAQSLITEKYGEARFPFTSEKPGSDTTYAPHLRWAALRTFLALYPPRSLDKRRVERASRAAEMFDSLTREVFADHPPARFIAQSHRAAALRAAYAVRELLLKVRDDFEGVRDGIVQAQARLKAIDGYSERHEKKFRNLITRVDKLKAKTAKEEAKRKSRSRTKKRRARVRAILRLIWLDRLFPRIRSDSPRAPRPAPGDQTGHDAGG